MKKAGVCSQQEIYRPVAKNEKIRVAFLFQIASFWPAWESLYDTLYRDERFSCKLFLVMDSVDKAKQLATAKKFLDQNGIAHKPFSDEMFESFAPHIAFLQTPYDYTQREHHLYSRRLKAKGIRVVYIPYGIEIANTRAARHDHFRTPVVKNAWRIYTLSDEFSREYEKYCENAGAVRGIGLPRFDSLQKRERFPLPIGMRKTIGTRKVLVWHTHFAKRIDVCGEKKQVTPYLEEYIRFAECLSRFADNVFCIFLPHPRFGDDILDEENNKKSKRILEIVKQVPNVYVDTADDYRSSLLHADAIITDRSALAVEAGIVGVPVLYCKNPDYEEPLFPPLVPIFNQYEQGTGYADMERFLRSFVAEEQIRHHAIKFQNLDEFCALRIADDIALSVCESSVKEKGYRFILWGTGFIYRTMMRMVGWKKKARIIALTDNDSEKWGQIIDGVEVIPPSKINMLSFDKIIICADNIFEEEIEKQILFELEIPRSKIEHCDYLSIV